MGSQRPSLRPKALVSQNAGTSDLGGLKGSTLLGHGSDAVSVTRSEDGYQQGVSSWKGHVRSLVEVQKGKNTLDYTCHS